MHASRPERPIVYAVYRKRNAGTLLRLVETVVDQGGECRLWALDEVAAELEQWTTGVGPGLKFALISGLVRQHPPAAGDAAVVADDDVVLDPGGLVKLIEMSVLSGLDLAQPAHARDSHWSHEITRRRRWSRVRLTNFVEIGPLFLVRARGHELLKDLPQDMGWGLELDWLAASSASRAQLGIVDAVAMRHLQKPGTNYDLTGDRRRTEERLAGLGYDEWSDVQKTVRCWRTWRSSPPWRVDRQRSIP